MAPTKKRQTRKPEPEDLEEEQPEEDLDEEEDEDLDDEEEEQEEEDEVHAPQAQQDGSSREDKLDFTQFTISLNVNTNDLDLVRDILDRIS